MDFANWAGALCLLGGLGLTNVDRTRNFRRTISALNLLGGLLLAVAAWWATNYPVVGLNAIWSSISLAGFFRRHSRCRFVTITGAAGSGKTTLVRRVGAALEARGMQVRCYCSGQTYRAVAVAMASAQVPLDRERACLAWWRHHRPSLSASGTLQLLEREVPSVNLDGEQVAAWAGTIARHPRLRKKVVKLIRTHLATNCNDFDWTIIDARDPIVLTRGLPATHVYLSVPFDDRALRRAKQSDQSIASVRTMMRARDETDQGFGRVTEDEARRRDFLIVSGTRPIELITNDVVDYLVADMSNRRTS